MHVHHQFRACLLAVREGAGGEGLAERIPVGSGCNSTFPSFASLGFACYQAHSWAGLLLSLTEQEEEQ